MEEIISRIIEIEKKAQKVIKSAEDEKANLDKVLEVEISKMKKEIEDRADKKCETLKNLEDSEADKKIAEIEKKKQEVLKRLENIYKENINVWVDSITAEIINS